MAHKKSREVLKCVEKPRNNDLGTDVNGGENENTLTPSLLQGVPRFSTMFEFQNNWDNLRPPLPVVNWGETKKFSINYPQTRAGWGHIKLFVPNLENQKYGMIFFVLFHSPASESESSPHI